MSAAAQRCAEIGARIAAAAARAGRDPAAVTLIGASKMQPVETLRAAYEAGLHRFGENRVQEGLGKAAQLPPAIEWHLLGPLQSNKVRPALRLFRTFHAVDRPAIALDLDREAGKLGLAVDGFLEINLGGEASKHGFVPERLAEQLAPLTGLAHLHLRGLMAIPPPGDTPEAARPWFRQLRELARELSAAPGWRDFSGWLSMGMSDDFEVAIEEGATHVRLGTALFGPRSPAPAVTP